MLGWIPLIGPVIDGLVSMFNKYKDVEAIKYKTDGEVSIEGVKASAQIIEATKDDIGIRILRDAALVFPVTWSALIGWDTIVAIKWPWLMFHVPPYPAGVEYIPYAALVFLFGNIGINAWKRR